MLYERFAFSFLHLKLHLKVKELFSNSKVKDNGAFYRKDTLWV